MFGENPHQLSPTSEAILAEIITYHRARLYDFESRMDQNARARRMAETEGRTSIARAIVAMSTGSLRKQAPLEYGMFDRVHGDPQKIILPFSEFRDLAKASAPAGGYLVGTATQDPVDILRPWSVTARSGMLVETGLVGDQAIPKVTGKSVPQWLPTEGTQTTLSTPTLAQIVCTPKQVSAVIQFSRQLALQANADAFVRRELMRTIGTAIDQAVLNGSGAAGQPTGLLLTAGVQTQSGTTLQHAGVTAMKRMLAVANAPDEAIQFIGTPAVRELLENRLRAGNGSRYVWENDQLADRPARITTDLPTATLVAGAWEALYLGIWGPGFVVEINPFDQSGFKNGQIQARLIVSCDVAVQHAAAFSVASSIT